MGSQRSTLQTKPMHPMGYPTGCLFICMFLRIAFCDRMLPVFSRLAKMCDMVSALLINVLSSARLREPRERRGDPGFFFVILSLFSLFCDLQEKYIYKCQNLDRFTSLAKTYTWGLHFPAMRSSLARLREPPAARRSGVLLRSFRVFRG